MLLNYTNRPLLFVHNENLTALNNNRFQIAHRSLLHRREYFPLVHRPLRVHYQTDTVSFCHGVPVNRERLVGADPIPPGDDILIVSKQYADACRRMCRPTDRLRVVSGGVYLPTENFPIASLGLSEVEPCLAYQHPDLFIEDIDEVADYLYHAATNSDERPGLAVVDSPGVDSPDEQV